jgi:hypothetical protein
LTFLCKQEYNNNKEKTTNALICNFYFKILRWGEENFIVRDGKQWRLHKSRLRLFPFFFINF